MTGRGLGDRVGHWVVAHPKKALLFLVLAFLLCLPGIGRVRVEASIHKMIPQRTEVSRGLALALEGLLRTDTVYVLLELPAAAPPNPDALRAAAQALRSQWEQSELVHRVWTSPTEGVLETDPQLVLSLVDARLLPDLQARFAPEAAPRRATFLKQILSAPTGGEARDALLADPFGLLELLGRQAAQAVHHGDATGEGFLSPDGRALLLFVEPQGLAEGMASYPRLLRELRLGADVAMAGRPPMTVHFTGTPPYAVATEEATRSEAAMLSFVTLAAVLVLYGAFYRSLLSFGLVISLLLASTTATFGLGGYLYSALNPIAVSFAALLFGMGMDPAIHLSSEYRERRRFVGPEIAARETVGALWGAIWMASITTVLALFGIALLNPNLLGQMGVLAGIGVVGDTVVMLVGLPALWILVGERVPPDPGHGLQGAQAYANLVRRRPWPIVLPVVLGLVALASLLPRAGFDAAFRGFMPESLPPVVADRAIQHHMGEAMGKLVVLVRGTEHDAVLQANDAVDRVLRQLHGEAGVDAHENVAAVWPAAGRRRAQEDAARAAVDVPAAVTAMETALQAEGFRIEPFRPAFDRLLAWHQGADAPVDAPPWLHNLERKHVLRVGEDWRVLTNVYPREGDLVPLAERIRAALPPPPPGVEVFVTGQELLTIEAGALMERGLPALVGLSAGLLLVTLVPFFRRPRHVAIALLPLLLEIAAFLGGHAVLGVPVTIFSLAAIPLLLGIGVDNHVYMIDRFLAHGRLEGALGGAGRAVLVSNLTILAAFGVLGLSRFDALALFGRAVGASLLLTFTGSVVLVPALIRLLLKEKPA